MISDIFNRDFFRNTGNNCFFPRIPKLKKLKNNNLSVETDIIDLGRTVYRITTKICQIHKKI